jgi:hypothetical protein
LRIWSEINESENRRQAGQETIASPADRVGEELSDEH